MAAPDPAPVQQHVLRHRSPVSSVAITPDGQRIITGTRDNVVYIWDAATAAILKSCKGHLAPHQICALACTHNNQQFASGGRDSTICVWDREGKLLTQLKWKHRAYVTSLAYAEDHKYLVSGSADGTIYVWDPTRNGARKVLEKAHSGAVTAVAVSRDSKFVVSGGDDHAVSVWTPEGPLGSYGSRCAGKLYRTMTHHEAEVTGVAIFSDNSHVVSTSMDRKARVFLLTSKRCVRTLEHASAVHCLSLTTDDKWLVTGTTAGLLHLWRVADGHLHCTVPAHDQPILALAATVAGRVVSAGNDMVAKVWQLPLEGGPSPDAAEGMAAPRPAVAVVQFARDGRLRVADPAAWHDEAAPAGEPHATPAETVANASAEAEKETMTSADPKEKQPSSDAAQGKKRPLSDSTTGQGTSNVTKQPKQPKKKKK